MSKTVPARAPRNRTLTLSESESRQYAARLLRPEERPLGPGEIENRTICGDLFRVLPLLPDRFCDLILADPPYNLAKDFGGTTFRRRPAGEYERWLESWLPEMRRLLRSNGSIYVCGDWRCSAAIQRVLETAFTVRNRITWEREKGRGAKSNWKNASEDIWFATVSEDYTFNLEAVMLKRKVIAPYTDSRGQAKDWNETEAGRFRLTHPSNLWSDISVPFWSMPENTEHPTQKPEKLLAKIILAGSNPGDMVFDPFLGAGTSEVVAKKLDRRYCGVELNERYCTLAEKRLELAATDRTIQGYADSVFWERNTGK